MIHTRFQVFDPRRSTVFVALALALAFLLLAVPSAALASGAGDGVRLAIEKGPSPGQVTLTWEGGTPRFTIYRSPSPIGIADPANELGTTDERTWTDTPPPGTVFFYEVSSPCVFDPPERCDGIDNDCDGTVDGPGSEASCDLPNATEECLAGTCGIAFCDEDFGDCDLDAANGCEIATTSDPANCGACGLGCALPNASAGCGAGACFIETCAADFFDLNGAAQDGCEYSCSFQSAIDLPDPGFVDANCDGIDGDAANAVFVSPTGDDANPGTRELPVRTILAGLDLAETSASNQVLLDEGLYLERVDLRDGIGLFGGYARGANWQRSPASTATINGGLLSMAADGIAAETIVERVRIESDDVTTPGASTYGVRAVSSPGLVLRDVTVVAGRGLDGIAGQPGFLGANGGDGSRCGEGCENGGFLCSACSRPSGGSAGSSACGRSGAPSTCATPAEIVFAHVGATDPTDPSEGWTRSGTSATVPGGPIVGDRGVDAWQVDDNSTASGSTTTYLHTPTPEQIGDAETRGWVLRTRLRVASSPDTVDFSIYCEYANGTERYSLRVGHDFFGQPQVELFGGPSLTLADLDDGYHLYELIYDPDRGVADLYINGVRRLADYAGAALTLERVVWGSGETGTTGEGRYALVEWGLLTCGDGVVDAGELCDDGNLLGGDGCSHACTIEP